MSLICLTYFYRVLAIRSGPVSGLQVRVQSCPWQPQENRSSTVVKDAKWAELGGPFKDVHMNKMDGRNFVSKVELLMACLNRESHPTTY